MKNPKTGGTDSPGTVTDGNPGIQIIAEIGTSHNGDLRHARKLIQAAADAGADSVKTQIIFADEIIHPNTGEVALPGGSIRLYDRFRELEKDFGFYRELKRITEDLGLEFLASPFGLKSLDCLLRLDVDSIKIASPELNHFPLLKAAAASGKKLMLSTGVAELSDIAAAVEITGTGRTVLLHCITAYPAPEEEYNLLVIPELASAFGVSTGISDHSLGAIPVPAAAAAVGAVCIEKHLTIGNDDGGLDDPIALTPAEFSRMCEEIRKIEALPVKEREATVREDFGNERITRLLGSGIKSPAPSERANYGRTNRSVHAVSDLPAGTLLDSSNTALLRTEKKLRPGIRPEFYDEIIGLKLVRNVGSGEGIRASDLGLCRDAMDFPL